MSKFDLDKYLKDLEELVNHESFTHDFENLNKTADYLVKNCLLYTSDAADD